eukprot:11015143-Alexandrium_andersonii.AAC.1
MAEWCNLLFCGAIHASEGLPLPRSHSDVFDRAEPVPLRVDCPCQLGRRGSSAPGPSGSNSSMTEAIWRPCGPYPLR